MCSNLYIVPNPWFFCWFPLYIKYFKCLLRLNTMIFLSFPKWFHTYSNLYLVPNAWFFFLLPLYFIFLLFFFYFGPNPWFFCSFFFISWISNLYLGPTLWSFSFSYIIQDKSKPLLCAKPMIFLSSFFVNRYKFMIFLLFQLINQQIILHFGKGLSFFCSFFNNL